MRRVVDMLQMMQGKIEAEAARETELFEKFDCYCRQSQKSLAASIGDAEARMPQLESEIKASEAEKSQLRADIADGKRDRDEVKATIQSATALRQKEAKAYKDTKSEGQANVEAMGKATEALRKGLGAGFIQTSAAAQLRRLVGGDELDEADREVLGAFLAQGHGSPGTDEIIGVIAQVKETMVKDLADAADAEEKAAQDFEALLRAKTREAGALQRVVEEKTARRGACAVELENMKEDLDDTRKALDDDKKFIKDLVEDCSAKKAEWDERQKTRSEEKNAIADTIKILNDDDALELFKKTLPSPSFLQVAAASPMDARRRAAGLLRARGGDPRVDLIAVALRHRKTALGEVMKMIDSMINLLRKEQYDDDGKKYYCAQEFDATEDEQKVLARTVKDINKRIEKDTSGLASLAEEIKALEAGIADLDANVAKATKQRKEEHADFVEEMAANNAAKEIIGLAKKRLSKFYDPPAAKAALAQAAESAEVAPPPPPETMGAYKKKGEDSQGALDMMEALRADLSKEIQEMEVGEKHAQKDYERFVADSAAKRAGDVGLLAEKERIKADLKVTLEANGQEKIDKQQEMVAGVKYLQSLHQECDFLVSNYGTRKEARTAEIGSLTKAKDVLAGAKS